MYGQQTNRITKMDNAKTPADVAKMFGCTEEQALAQIDRNAKDLRASAEKARASNTGKYRGLTTVQYEERAQAFGAVL